MWCRFAGTSGMGTRIRGRVWPSGTPWWFWPPGTDLLFSGRVFCFPFRVSVLPSETRKNGNTERNESEVAVTIETRLQRSKHHVLTRIADTPIGRAPFWHLFIDRVLPAELYEGLRARMLHHKHGTEVQDRLQDNA